MTFTHLKTERPALWITETFLKGGIPVKSWEDLRDISDKHPEMWWSDTFNIMPEVEKQGQRALYCFLQAFFKKPPKIMYFLFMPSGFPDGKTE